MENIGMHLYASYLMDYVAVAYHFSSSFPVFYECIYCNCVKPVKETVWPDYNGIKKFNVIIYRPLGSHCSLNIVFKFCNSLSNLLFA